MFRFDNKKRIPPSFVQEVSSGTTFRNLSAEAREDIRAHLLSEQGNRCAYCERCLRENHKTVLEHFHPQNMTGTRGSQCIDRIGRTNPLRSDVNLGNILVSCDGHKQHSGSRLTCDASKGGEDICAKFFNPKHQRSTTLVSVHRSGHICAVHFPDSEELAQGVLDVTLNLNDRYLCAARERVTDAWRAQWRKEILKNNSKKNVSMKFIRSEFAKKLRQSAFNAEFPSTLESIAMRIENGGSP